MSNDAAAGGGQASLRGQTASPSNLLGDAIKTPPPKPLSPAPWREYTNRTKACNRSALEHSFTEGYGRPAPSAPKGRNAPENAPRQAGSVPGRRPGARQGLLPGRVRTVLLRRLAPARPWVAPQPPSREALVQAWATGFSAFGFACADLEYPYDLTADIATSRSSRCGGRPACGTRCASACLQSS
jgi:hypothetical protein